MKKYLLYLLKIAATGLFIWFFLQKIDLAKSWSAITSVSLWVIFWAFIISIISWYLNSIRWQSLLRIVGVKISSFQLFLYNLIGNFYSVILPGGKLTGDAACAYRFTKDLADPESKEKYFISVFIDRFMGVFTIVGILSFFFIIQHPVIYLFGTQFAVILGILTTVATIGGLIVLLSPIFDFFLRWLSRLPLGALARAFNHLLDALIAYRKNLPALSLSLFYSIIGMFATPFAAYVVGKGLGLEVGFAEIIFAYSLATALIIIPITIGGVGLREGGIVLFLSRAGADVSKSAALSIIMFAVFVVLSLVGGALEFYHHFLKKSSSISSR